MATVKFFKNILEDSFETITVKDGTSIESVIRDYGDDDVYISNFVECYDADTDTTSFVPLSDDEGFGFVCSVNGEDKPKEYELQENDQCLIIVTPMSSSNENWSWPGAWGGLVAGAVLGMFTGGAVFGIEASILATGGIFGGLVGFVAGGISFRDQQLDPVEFHNNPENAGSTNQLITGNQVPLLIGKMEVAPMVSGSPWVEYRGIGGKDTYVHALYEVAYAPIRVSDFKIDGLRLTKGERNGKYLYAGKLKDSEIEGGDFLSKWNFNEPEIEIIQQNEGQPLYYGDIYPWAKKQHKVDATASFIKDSAISDLEEQSDKVRAIVNYHNKDFDDGFRTNTVKFSDQYAKNLEVFISLPDALYAERSANSTTDRKDIPLHIAVQWRPYSQARADSEDMTVKQQGDSQHYNYEYSDDNPFGWHTFDTIRVDDEYLLSHKTFTNELMMADVDAHEGNNLKQTVTKDEPHSNESVIGWLNIEVGPKGAIGTPAKAPILIASREDAKTVKFTNTNVDDSYHFEFIEYTEATGYKKLYVPGDMWKYCQFTKDEYAALPTDENGKYCFCKNWPKASSSTETVYFGNDGWIGAQVFNLQEAQAYVTANRKTPEGKDNFNVSEIRLVANMDLDKWCEDNDKDPMSYLYSDDNTTKAIEVRVIRVSPNYLDQIKTDNNSKIGPWTYHDEVKWTVLGNEMYHIEDDAIAGTERPHPDRKYTDTCFIAFKCKLDNVGNIQNQIGKFSCMANAFAPRWDREQRKWLPENIVSSYKYFDGKEEITKEEYEHRRQTAVINGTSSNAERVKGGTNWLSSITSEIFGQTAGDYTNPLYASSDGPVYITNSASKYIENWESDDMGSDSPTAPLLGKTVYNNSSASGFMLACVGRHMGKDALGYDKVHLLSTGEWFEDCQAVDDGAVDKNTNQPIIKFMACNAYIYQAVKFENLLSSIATSGRAGYTIDDNGRLVTVMDKPVPYPVGIFNNQNALSVSVAYDFKAPPSGIMLSFKNEANRNIDQNLPVMMDDEDPKNPKREIEQGSLNYVTNIDQVHSLGRYMLATKIFGKRAITWKCGIEGFDIQYGNVVKVASDQLLIGQGCGRIAELIEDDEFIYGMILTESYQWPGDGKDYAVEIMQPLQYGVDRVIIVSVLGSGSVETKDGKKIRCQKKGITNKVVFANRIKKGSTMPDPSQESKSYYFDPQVGDNVNFGIKGKQSELYRVKSKTPDTNFTFTFLLISYDPSFYNYGSKMPVLNNNMTIPSRVDMEISGQVSRTELNSRVNGALNEAIGYTDEVSKLFKPTPTYRIETSQSVLQKKVSGNYYDSEVTLKASVTLGDTPTTEYSGIFKVYSVIDENVRTLIHTSPVGSSYTFNAPTDATYFSIELYTPEGRYLTLTTIGIVKDGETTPLDEMITDFSVIKRMTNNRYYPEKLTVYKQHYDEVGNITKQPAHFQLYINGVYKETIITSEENFNAEFDYLSHLHPNERLNYVRIQMYDIGEDGEPGPFRDLYTYTVISDGKNFSVKLKNPFQQYESDQNGWMPERVIKTSVEVYNGLEEVKNWKFIDLPYEEAREKGFELEVDRDTLTIIAKAGTAMPDQGSFDIPIFIITEDDSARLLGDNGEEVIAGSSNDEGVLGEVSPSPATFIYKTAFSWVKVKLGQEIVQPALPTAIGVFDDPLKFPTDAKLGDYILYVGENKGTFKKLFVYQWDGIQWAEDNSGEHKMAYMTEAIKRLSAETGIDPNAPAFEFIKTLYASEVFTNFLGATKIMLNNGGYLQSTSTTASGTPKAKIQDDGESWFENAHIRGEVHATSGSFNNVTISGSTVDGYATTGDLNALSNTLNSVIDTSIQRVDVEYALSDSPSVAPTSGWTTTAPAWVNGKYMWQRTAITKNGSTSYSAVTCIAGAQGNRGATGRGVSAIQEEYALSTTNAYAPADGWSESCPAIPDNYFLWVRSRISWDDGTVSYSTATVSNALTENGRSITLVKNELGEVTVVENNAVKINGGKIVAGSVATASLAAGCVTAEKIQAGAITADKIQADTVLTQKLSATDLHVSGTSEFSGASMTVSDVMQSSNFEFNTGGIWGFRFYAGSGQVGSLNKGVFYVQTIMTNEIHSSSSLLSVKQGLEVINETYLRDKIYKGKWEFISSKDSDVNSVLRTIGNMLTPMNWLEVRGSMNYERIGQSSTKNKITISSIRFVIFEGLEIMSIEGNVTSGITSDHFSSGGDNYLITDISLYY
ncbi:MAG: hypothetical protein MJZ11_07975 [Lachnospiraceae bacterium]|nr:hypothetical protein [Lachnospiraceae bacterium]